MAGTSQTIAHTQSAALLFDVETRGRKMFFQSFKRLKKKRKKKTKRWDVDANEDQKLQTEMDHTVEEQNICRHGAQRRIFAVFAQL